MVLYLLLVVVISLAVYEATPVPGALLARTIIDSYNNIKIPLNYSSIANGVSVTRNIAIRVQNAPTASIDIYTPKKDSTPRPIILWIHGGALVGGTKEQTQVYSTLLASNGYTVASLEYTRPPDALYPTPIIQANTTLSFLRGHAQAYGGDPTQFFIAGNSAGAQIASQVAAVETNTKLANAMHITPTLPQGTLHGAILYCGAYDMTTFQDIRAPFFNIALRAYTGYQNWHNFPDLSQLSTAKQATPNYPPVFLAGGDADPLTPQSHEFASVLRKLHVPVTTQFWEGSGAKLGHDYQFQLNRPEARQTFRDSIKFMQSKR